METLRLVEVRVRFLIEGNDFKLRQLESSAKLSKTLAQSSTWWWSVRHPTGLPPEADVGLGPESLAEDALWCPRVERT